MIDMIVSSRFINKNVDFPYLFLFAFIYNKYNNINNK